MTFTGSFPRLEELRDFTEYGRPDALQNGGLAKRILKLRQQKVFRWTKQPR